MADVIESELAKGAGLSVIDLVDSLIVRACGVGASDIHLDPTDTGVQVRFRLDGSLQDMFVLPQEVHSSVITRIKVLAGLRTDEHQAAQDGRFQAFLESARADVRVSIAPTFHGEDAVLRLLTGRAEQLTIGAMGLADADRDRLLHAVHRAHGMILATGPTGSGKTTSLYTLINLINTRDISIITIEDPVEYAIAGINQIPVNARTSLTFANGLRSVLRQDPDVIMVGEIRDSETASIAVNTALTGHLLLSTLHTNNAATSVARLLDMHIEPYLIASTLSVVLGQRLVRKLCIACRVPHTLSDAEYQRTNVILGHQPPAAHQFFEPHGCAVCGNTGYKGRMGIYEVLVMDDDVREACLRHAASEEIKTIAMINGMTTMIQDGVAKAATGLTTLAEVFRVTHE